MSYYNDCCDYPLKKPRGKTIPQILCNHEYRLDVLEDERLINTVTQYDLITDLPDLEDGILAYVKENQGLYIGDNGNVLLNEAQPTVIRNFNDVKDFGALGDGVTDDSSSIQNAIDDLVSKGGGVLYFPTATYVIKQMISLDSNIIVELNNSIIDGSTLTAELFDLTGTQETEISLLSDSLTGSKQITLDSVNGLNIGDYLLIKSTRTTGSTNQKQGQFVRISNIAGTVVDLYTKLQDDYLIAENSQVAKMNFKHNTYVRNGKFIGNPDISKLTIGIQFMNTKNTGVDNCIFENTNFIGISYYDSMNAIVNGCEFIDIQATGLAYGVSMVYNVENIYVNNCFGVNHRHLTTTGGGTTDFGIPKNIVVTNCTAYGMLDAGFDFHPAGRNVQVKGCFVDGSGSDGIVLQAESFICDNNIVQNCGRHGILIQNSANNPMVGKCTNNSINDVVSNGISIGLTDEYNLVNSLIITGNHIEKVSVYGIQQGVALTVQEDKNIVISSNTFKNVANRGVYMRSMNGLLINDNIFEGDMSTVMYMLNTNQCTISGNKMNDNTAIGIRLIGSDDNIITNNIISGTDAIDLDSASDYNLVSLNNVRSSSTGIDDNGTTNTVINNIT